MANFKYLYIPFLALIFSTVTITGCVKKSIITDLSKPDQIKIKSIYLAGGVDRQRFRSNQTFATHALAAHESYRKDQNFIMTGEGLDCKKSPGKSYLSHFMEHELVNAARQSNSKIEFSAIAKQEHMKKLYIAIDFKRDRIDFDIKSAKNDIEPEGYDSVLYLTSESNIQERIDSPGISVGISIESRIDLYRFSDLKKIYSRKFHFTIKFTKQYPEQSKQSVVCEAHAIHAKNIARIIFSDLSI